MNEKDIMKPKDIRGKRKKVFVGYVMPYDYCKKEWFRWESHLTSQISIWQLKHYSDYKKVKITIEEL